MNQFIYCVETERGVMFGRIKTQDGLRAKQEIEAHYRGAGHKVIGRIELQGFLTSPNMLLQEAVFKKYDDGSLESMEVVCRQLRAEGEDSSTWRGDGRWWAAIWNGHAMLAKFASYDDYKTWRDSDKLFLKR